MLSISVLFLVLAKLGLEFLRDMIDRRVQLGILMLGHELYVVIGSCNHLNYLAIALHIHHHIDRHQSVVIAVEFLGLFSHIRTDRLGKVGMACGHLNIHLLFPRLERTQ